MRARLLLVAVSALSLFGASKSSAADLKAEAPQTLAVVSPTVAGCGQTPAAEATAPPALNVLKMDPISLATGTCGACSFDGCAGQARGTRCWTQWVGWAYCIPPETNFCDAGPQGSSNWACRCATEYL